MATFFQDLSSGPAVLAGKLNSSVRVLVAEPDAVSRRLICSVLEREPDVIFECVENSDIVAGVQEASPDLVIVDAQTATMMRAHNWEALGVKSPPASIVTSYGATKLVPFASGAADLLVKPFSVEQFENAMQVAQSKILGARTILTNAIEYKHGDDRIPDRPKFLQRFAAESEGRIALIKIADVLWLQSFGNYIRVHSAGATHLVRNTMRKIEPLLDPTLFVRIHRNAIVNLDHVVEFFLPATGNMFVKLDSGVSLPLRRSIRASLRKFLKQHSLV